jgi:hypothetical protein
VGAVQVSGNPISVHSPDPSKNNCTVDNHSINHVLAER